MDCGYNNTGLYYNFYNSSYQIYQRSPCQDLLKLKIETGCFAGALTALCLYNRTPTNIVVKIVISGYEANMFYIKNTKTQSEGREERLSRDAVVGESIAKKDRELEKKKCTTGTDERLQDAGQQHHEITITRSANQMRFRMNSRERAGDDAEMVDSQTSGGSAALPPVYNQHTQ